MKLPRSMATAWLVGTGLGLVACAAPDDAWIVPRSADGRPDLQGDWTNGTMTPLQRPEGEALVLTPEQVAEREGAREEFIDGRNAPSDPDREAPPVGGDGSTGAAGGVGGYNYFWIDAGDRVAVFNGEPRSSLITRPEDGRIPDLTPEGRRRRIQAFQRLAGEFDNPENRPVGERCILSFGSNAGPPMLPNYFYNNNYTIVQTPDHIMIMTEMVHDVRIIRMGEPNPLPGGVRPWLGDSWGRWEGDTLVVRTTNLNPDQLAAYAYLFAPGSENMTVTERFTRTDEHTINYEFTVEDPDTFESSWGGEVPFTRLDGQLYEYACHEGNYALSNVLSGARAQEREAAAISGDDSG
ncbi:hypothetical protein [Candidatus Palauibacter sp.]|uniref:hypothetical protein n=1 Tax=Candidatus Palauibacter sp. TaxID=3101350 RepID=UPI003AF2C1AA